jgi:hypothetical protein
MKSIEIVSHIHSGIGRGCNRPTGVDAQPLLVDNLNI